VVERIEARGLQSVDIGVPRIVEYETGRIVPSGRPASPATNGSVALPLDSVSLRRTLERELGLRVVVDNHSNVTAFAEAHDDAYELVTRDLVMINVGNGVGGGKLRSSTGFSPSVSWSYLVTPGIPQTLARRIDERRTRLRA